MMIKIQKQYSPAEHLKMCSTNKFDKLLNVLKDLTEINSILIGTETISPCRASPVDALEVEIKYRIAPFPWKPGDGPKMAVPFVLVAEDQAISSRLAEIIEKQCSHKA